ncbi:MAG: DUF4249 domain-containing protein [Crocinitomicaceae bacterium]|nr:DUF4249 domain-containing protein [Crocinitomicaceae bacterium]
MKKLIYICLSVLVLTGCTKEVQIDIPGYAEQLVIDGRIETGQPPIVLISRSKEVYASTDLNAFLNGYVSGAIVTVSNGTTTVQLDTLCSNNLPPGTEEIAAAMLGIPVDQLEDYTICAYSTLNSQVWGEIGKTYTLNVSFEGKSYAGETTILPPTPLVNTFWKADDDTGNYGYSWATLADPPGQFDAYFWEIRRINKDVDGVPIDDNFTETYAPVFDDEFFDGLTFEFAYENPRSFDPSTPESLRGYYKIGDTVVIKFSKIDHNVYDFFEKKYIQLQTAGNPFATPTNIPTNLSNGALGIWAGFSPSFDTLICQP